MLHCVQQQEVLTSQDVQILHMHIAFLNRMNCATLIFIYNQHTYNTHITYHLFIQKEKNNLKRDLLDEL